MSRADYLAEQLETAQAELMKLKSAVETLVEALDELGFGEDDRVDACDTVDVMCEHYALLKKLVTEQETPTCPKCGSHTFTIDAALSTKALVEFDDDDHTVMDEVQGDMEWDDDSTATCDNCGHVAPLGEMK